jgi:hypothetical protein
MRVHKAGQHSPAAGIEQVCFGVRQQQLGWLAHGYDALIV